MKLKIEEIPAEVGYKRWLFLDFSKPEESNYRFRWAIEWREGDDWWGVVALFPMTHEKAIKRIAREMELARKAIKEIKKTSL